jgi:hypothetical protein
VKVCNNCGSENPNHNEFCANCKVPLPAAISGGDGDGDQAAEKTEDEMSRYNDIKKACDKVQDGEWSVEEFDNFLQDLMRLLARHEGEIREVEIPPESMDDFSMELDTGFSGVELYNEGLATLMLYVDEQNPSYLQAGLDLVLKGNQRINEAIRMNRKTRNSMGEVKID